MDGHQKNSRGRPPKAGGPGKTRSEQVKGGGGGYRASLS